MDTLSRLGIDDLNIEEEETLVLLSESERSNIKFLIHSALMFKEHTRIKGLKENGVSQPHFSL